MNPAVSNFNSSDHLIGNTSNNSTLTTFMDAYVTFSVTLACVILGIAMCGMVGNAFCIYVYSRAYMKSSINTLLTGLGIIDFALLLLVIPVFVLPGVNEGLQLRLIYQGRAYFAKYLYPLNMITQTSSTWIMVLITVERFIAVCYPLQAKSWCTLSKSRTSLLITISVAIGYNLVRFWEYDVVQYQINNQTMYQILPNLRADADYFNGYFCISYLVMHFLIPFTLIMFLNSFMVKTILVARREREHLTRQQKGEHRTAIMMVVVIVVFTVCNVTPLVLNFTEWINPTFFEDPQTVVLAFALNDVANLLVVMNSGSTFLIYWVFSQRFRRVFKVNFRRWLPDSCMAEVSSRDYCLSINGLGGISLISQSRSKSSAQKSSVSSVPGSRNESPISAASRLLVNSNSRSNSAFFPQESADSWRKPSSDRIRVVSWGTHDMKHFTRPCTVVHARIAGFDIPSVPESCESSRAASPEAEDARSTNSPCVDPSNGLLTVPSVPDMEQLAEQKDARRSTRRRKCANITIEVPDVYSTHKKTACNMRKRGSLPQPMSPKLVRKRKRFFKRVFSQTTGEETDRSLSASSKESATSVDSNSFYVQLLNDGLKDRRASSSMLSDLV